MNAHYKMIHALSYIISELRGRMKKCHEKLKETNILNRSNVIPLKLSIPITVVVPRQLFMNVLKHGYF